VTSRGLYVPSHVSEEPVEQRIVEAAAVLPPGAGVTGWAGLRWSGGYWFDGLAHDGEARLPVTLATGDSTIVAQAGFEVSEEHLRRELTTLDGLPLTPAVRSVTYLMRHAPTLRDAVVALDMAAYNDLVSLSEVANYVPTLATWTGVPQCRKALALGDENAWSPREVEMRLIWTLDAELPRVLTNRPVFDRRGNHIGTPDLLDEEAGMALEYNGAVHLVSAQHRRDRDREEGFRRVGLEVFTMVGGDVDSDVVARRMHEVRSRARFAGPSRRNWTVEPPPWWTPTFTVAQRRDLDPALRDRLLRFRLRPGSATTG
jgi:hypothetical protein